RGHTRSMQLVEILDDMGNSRAFLRGRSAISGAPASKGPSRRGCAPLAYDEHGIGAPRRPTCNTWPSPRRSMWTGLWPGSTSAPEPRRGSPALPPWPLRPWAIQARQPPKVLASPLHSNPCCTASLAHIFYYKNIYCIKLVEKSLMADVWADRKLLLGKRPCLF